MVAPSSQIHPDTRIAKQRSWKTLYDPPGRVFPGNSSDFFLSYCRLVVVFGTMQQLRKESIVLFSSNVLILYVLEKGPMIDPPNSGL